MQPPLYQQEEGSACARGCSSGDRPVPIMVSMCPDLMVTLHGHRAGAPVTPGCDPKTAAPRRQEGAREDGEETIPTCSCYIPRFIHFLEEFKAVRRKMNSVILIERLAEFNEVCL